MKEQGDIFGLTQKKEAKGYESDIKKLPLEKKYSL